MPAALLPCANESSRSRSREGVLGRRSASPGCAALDAHENGSGASHTASGGIRESRVEPPRDRVVEHDFPHVVVLSPQAGRRFPLTEYQGTVYRPVRRDRRLQRSTSPAGVCSYHGRRTLWTGLAIRSAQRLSVVTFQTGHASVETTVNGHRFLPSGGHLIRSASNSSSACPSTPGAGERAGRVSSPPHVGCGGSWHAVVAAAGVLRHASTSTTERCYSPGSAWSRRGGVA
jgi:hypothetical protein